MIIIDNILVSEDVLDQQFVCNLQTCKGACCWEGDWGAPLENKELDTLKIIREKIRPFLTEESNAVLDKGGPFSFYEEPKKFGTPLLPNGICVYLNFDEKNVGQCGIEKAYTAGIVDFIKPMSCHLYPVRVTEHKELDFIAINYDVWEICSTACSLGKSLKVPVYSFVKNALIRKFGGKFFQQLKEIAKNRY